MPALFSHPHWNEERRPLENETDELARIDRYWAWLNGINAADGADFITVLPDGHHVVVLQSAEDADYEATYMQHSIGFNWQRYSALGAIYSLRTSDNVPVITCLVAQNEIMQARIFDNALPEGADYALLRQFADMFDFQITQNTNHGD